MISRRRQERRSLEYAVDGVHPGGRCEGSLHMFCRSRCLLQVDNGCHFGPGTTDTVCVCCCECCVMYIGFRNVHSVLLCIYICIIYSGVCQGIENSLRTIPEDSLDVSFEYSTSSVRGDTHTCALIDVLCLELHLTQLSDDVLFPSYSLRA